MQVDAAKILDFDIENRPLTYLGQDFTTADITAIAMGWMDEDEIDCLYVDSLGRGQRFMLARFVSRYNEADIVTGHYIRKHDLPLINGALLENCMTPLQPKLTIDTKLDLITASGVSKSQESLGAMLGLEAPKVHMTQADWRSANRLTPEGIAKTRDRCVGDVIQHKQMYAELVRRGLLGPPKLWQP